MVFGLDPPAACRQAYVPRRRDCLLFFNSGGTGRRSWPWESARCNPVRMSVFLQARFCVRCGCSYQRQKAVLV